MTIGWYNLNEYETISGDGDEEPEYGRVGSRNRNPRTGRKKIWNGLNLMREEGYDRIIQQGGWDYDGGWGLLKNPTTYGTVQNNFHLANSGVFATRYVTAAAPNSPSGVRFPLLMSTRRSQPILSFTTVAGNTTDTKHFLGWASYTSQVPVGAGVTNPFSNSDSGIMLGFIQGSNFMIYVNDGTGAPPSPIDTGIAPIASRLFQFTIELQNTTNIAIWQIRNAETDAILGNGVVDVSTNRLFANTVQLAPHFHCESTSSLAINIYLPTIRLWQRG